MGLYMVKIWASESTAKAKWNFFPLCFKIVSFRRNLATAPKWDETPLPKAPGFSILHCGCSPASNSDARGGGNAVSPILRHSQFWCFQNLQLKCYRMVYVSLNKIKTEISRFFSRHHENPSNSTEFLTNFIV
jgi:hypothetical protein